jgi:hypothetical protein
MPAFVNEGLWKAVTQVDFVTQLPTARKNQNGLFHLDAPNLFLE